MTIETWTSVGTLLGVLVSLGGLVVGTGLSLKRDIGRLDNKLESKVDGLRTELKGDIDGLRTELKGDIGRLDDRVYALASGLRPRLEAEESPSGH